MLQKLYDSNKISSDSDVNNILDDWIMVFFKHGEKPESIKFQVQDLDLQSCHEEVFKRLYIRITMFQHRV